MNEDADMIINSGENRRILVNGVDILARFDTIEELIQAQDISGQATPSLATLSDMLGAQTAQVATVAILHATISSLTSAVVAQAATITTLSDATMTQTITIANLTSRLASLEGDPERSIFPEIRLVLGDLDCKRVFSFHANVSTPVAPGPANLVNGRINGFCNETWVQSIGGTWNVSLTNLTSFDLNALARIDGNLDVTYNRLTHINLGTLTFVGGHIDLRSNRAEALFHIALGNLGHVGGTVYLLDTEFTIRNGMLTSVAPINWTGKQFLDLGTGGVATIHAPSVTLSANTVLMGGVTTVIGNLTILSATTLGFGALVTVHGSFAVLGQQVSLVSGTLSGTMEWASKAILAVHVGSLRRITGDLYLHNNQMTTFSLASVTDLTGNVQLFSNHLTSISFGALASIGGFVNLYNNFLTTIAFDSLTFIGGSLNLPFNKLTEITFGPLIFIGGYLGLYQNKFTSISFGTLVIGDDLKLYQNLLQSVTFPATLSVGKNITLCDNPGVASLLVSCLARYGSSQCDARTTC